MNRINNPKYWLQLIITTPFTRLRHRPTKYSTEAPETVLDNSAFPGMAYFPTYRPDHFSFDPRK